MEKNSTNNNNNKSIPFDIPLLKIFHKIDKDYFEGKLRQCDNIKYETDKAIKLGQAMYETSTEIIPMHYRNILTIFGTFSEICKNRYDIDVSLNDFFRVQKIVREYSEKVDKLEKTQTGLSHIA